jgi:dTDP-4-dehydrorhamnose 3,5-epimerase
MRFHETPLPGVWLIEPEPIEDERGFFARVFDADEFAPRDLHTFWPECSISFNRKAGTLRGMHWQDEPFAEVKLVRCTSGAIYDVALDLRPDSSTFKNSFAVELSAENRQMLYIPQGCAHGFQTLQDNSEVFYQISTFYHAPSARGVRFDDPAFSLKWPLPVSAISERDQRFLTWEERPKY